MRLANLSGADLSGANLSGAGLRGANLSGATINDTTQIDNKWRLVWVIVTQGAVGRDLSGADLSEAYLRNGILQNADLSGADLSGADLSGADLSGADLSRANLRRSKIDDTTQIDNKWRLTRQIISGGWIGRNLSGVDLSEAYLRNGILQKANLRGANLRGANLMGADLSGADLSGADMMNAVLNGANLRKADLSEAVLFNANLSEADLRGTDLSRADLSGVDLQEARYNSDTIWPREFDTTQCLAPEGLFATLWQGYSEELGCPLSNWHSDQSFPPTTFGEMPFQGGHMFLFGGSTPNILVTYGSGGWGWTGFGTWDIYPSAWEDGDPDFLCEQERPYPEQPIGEFGEIWCNYPQVREGLGWGIGEMLDQDRESPGEDVYRLQLFEGGFIFRDSDGWTYDLAYIFFDDGTFVRDSYD